MVSVHAKHFNLDMIKKIVNLILYMKWTDCIHDWVPVGFADWECSNCGVER